MKVIDQKNLQHIQGGHSLKERFISFIKSLSNKTGQSYTSNNTFLLTSFYIF